MELIINHRLPESNGKPSLRALAVAAIFGMEWNAHPQTTILQNVRVPVQPGQIVLITGDSGAGKSTLLRAIARELAERNIIIHTICPGMPQPKGCTPNTLVDALGDLPVEEALAHLARAGLSDARTLLQSPQSLSDGQRFRFELARFFAGEATVLLADEFCATLDRTTAKVVAYQLRKWISRTHRTAIVATTHDDLLADLQPDVVITLQLDFTTTKTNHHSQTH